MSALTKVFVILLVICSLLTTAAVVVFVNRVEDYRTLATRRESELETARRDNAAALNNATNLQAAAEAREQAANARIAAIQKDLLGAQQQVADKGVQLAEAQKSLALASLESTRLSEGLKASETTKAQLLDQVKQLRSSVDDSTKKNADLNAAVSDLTNRLDVTEKQRRFLSEQLTEAQTQVTRQAAALKGAGIGPEEAATAKTGAPSINGVIKAVKPIAGIPFATISVGSADSVAKGMEFKVIDAQRGVFYGVLTVDSVEPNESIGRLQGPRVEEIKPGLEVRTRL